MSVTYALMLTRCISVIAFAISLTLEKSSGKISYILSARELSIVWSDDPMFLEAVELRTIWWLEVHGKIKTKLLSPNTTYGAYLIIKILDRAYGLDSIPAEISVEVGRNQIFSLEKSTKKKRYILSARELSITWASNPLYWSWKPLFQSRFPEGVELVTIWWLEIKGKIKTQMLSPKTTYGAYLIVKIVDRAYGLDTLPSEVSVEVGNYQSRGSIYLRRHQSKKQSWEGDYFLNRIEALRSRAIKGEHRVPCEREDGWMEIELGEFYNDGGDEEVKMSLREVKGSHLKGGLVVEGIEVRPKE
ncbi:hypothetical protein L1049_021029 [Liquidambar formosana]|uniref:Uncharacterized protein n=1 Tax=Liquidambar formosana TaxID=63359 RepID=A0AAP0SDX5_LIQFO